MPGLAPSIAIFLQEEPSVPSVDAQGLQLTWEGIDTASTLFVACLGMMKEQSHLQAVSEKLTRYVTSFPAQFLVQQGDLLVTLRDVVRLVHALRTKETLGVVAELAMTLSQKLHELRLFTTVLTEATFISEWKKVLSPQSALAPEGQEDVQTTCIICQDAKAVLQNHPQTNAACGSHMCLDCFLKWVYTQTESLSQPVGKCLMCRTPIAFKKVLLENGFACE